MTKRVPNGLPKFAANVIKNIFQVIEHVVVERHLGLCRSGNGCITVNRNVAAFALNASYAAQIPRFTPEINAGFFYGIDALQFAKNWMI